MPPKKPIARMRDRREVDGLRPRLATERLKVYPVVQEQDLAASRRLLGLHERVARVDDRIGIDDQLPLELTDQGLVSFFEGRVEVRPVQDQGAMVQGANDLPSSGNRRNDDRVGQRDPGPPREPPHLSPDEAGVQPTHQRRAVERHDQRRQPR